MESRVLRVLDESDIETIANTYHAWQKGDGYENVPSFCYCATIEEICKQGFVLTPGRYVGATEIEVDENAESFDATMRRPAKEHTEQFAEANRLEATIQNNLLRMGYGK